MKSKKAKYLQQYWDFAENFKNKYGCEITIRELYFIYRDWILNYFDKDFNILRDNRPSFYNSIYNDLLWHFERLKDTIGGLNVDHNSPEQIVFLNFTVEIYQAIQKRITIDASKYLELMTLFGDINKDERDASKHYFKNAKLSNFESIINACQDYALIKALEDFLEEDNMSIRTFLKDNILFIESFVKLNQHAINNESEETSIQIGGDKIDIPQGYVYSLFENLKNDIFKLFEPFFSRFQLNTETQKIDFIKDCVYIIKIWVKNLDVISKSSFIGFQSQLPSYTETYIGKGEYSSGDVTKRDKYVVLYELLQIAFPKEVSSFENLRDSFSDGNLKNHLSWKSVDELDLDREMYFRLRDEVNKFMNPVWDKNW